MNQTINAYWDGKNYIRAHVSLDYYEGRVEEFNILDCNNQPIEVEIVSAEEKEDKVDYGLKVRNLDLDKDYYLVDERFLKVPLQYRFVVKSKEFEEKYAYKGDDLGFFYTKDYSTFKIWAPTARRVLLDLDSIIYTMEAQNNGTFSLKVEGEFEGASYQYLIYRNGQWVETIDPYGIASSENHARSVVLDQDKILNHRKYDYKDGIKNKTDAIIYEMHVRDFTIDDSSGVNHKGKYLGLIEKESHYKNYKTGLSHLIELGISHVQLMPIYDFGSVDEKNPERYYNWGYDPVQYNVPEGSYATRVSNPYSRIFDLIEMIDGLHKASIGVIMDVVYNHVFDRFTSSFEKVLPYYYFRFNEDGHISNGSFCGNDFDSRMFMARKYILYSIKHWMTCYGVDGFRFDLMGILDIETMNAIADLAENINPQTLIYGEGWNMPTALNDDDKAMMFNQDKLPKISHFNDVFRDFIKGDSLESGEKDKGFCLGNLENPLFMKNLIGGSNLNLDHDIFFDAPWKSINYVSCHDNQTAFDKILACDIPKNQQKKRHKLMLAFVLLSRGIPFIHSGQEFCRSKKGLHNSYRSGDEINKISWSDKIKHEDVFKYTKDLIALRKDISTIRYFDYKKDLKADWKENQKILTVNYGEDLIIIVNMGPKAYSVTNNGRIILNKDGKCYIKEEYMLESLELIVIKTN